MKIKLFVLVLCHPCHHIPFHKFLLVLIIYLFTLEAHSVVLISKQCNFSSSSQIDCCFDVNPTLCVNDIYLFFCLIFYWFFNDFNLCGEIHLLTYTYIFVRHLISIHFTFSNLIRNISYGPTTALQYNSRNRWGKICYTTFTTATTRRPTKQYNSRNRWGRI